MAQRNRWIPDGIRSQIPLTRSPIRSPKRTTTPLTMPPHTVTVTVLTAARNPLMRNTRKTFRQRCRNGNGVPETVSGNGVGYRYLRRVLRWCCSSAAGRTPIPPHLQVLMCHWTWTNPPLNLRSTAGDRSFPCRPLPKTLKPLQKPCHPKFTTKGLTRLSV